MTIIRTDRQKLIIVCLMITALVLACSSKYTETPSSPHLHEGATVISLVTLDGYTAEFEHKSGTLMHGTVSGTLEGGSEYSIGIDSVSTLEVERFNLLKTSLYTLGIGIVLAGVIYTVAIYELVQAI